MIELSPIEARVLGSLIEKEVTTPDQYPLSLKAVTVACNQKSNREPVMNLSEDEVQNTLDALSHRNLVAEVLFGGRVAKYKHRFCNAEFSTLHLNPRQLGVVCVMLLRGPQTLGELRTRTQRLCEFADVTGVESCLDSLIHFDKGALVAKLDREPGRRESRFTHLFSGPTINSGTNMPSETRPDFSEPSGTESTIETASSQSQRIHDLEQELQALRCEFDALKAEWSAFNE